MTWQDSLALKRICERTLEENSLTEKFMVGFFLANHTVDTVMGEIFNNSINIARIGWIENNIAKFLRGDEKIKIFEQKSFKVAVRAMKMEEE
jgi:hypothetical protein